MILKREEGERKVAVEKTTDMGATFIGRILVTFSSINYLEATGTVSCTCAKVNRIRLRFAFLTCIFPVLMKSPNDSLLDILEPFRLVRPVSPQCPGIVATVAGEACVASISSIKIAWLRLLLSLSPVAAVRLAFVPRETSMATDAAELTGTRRSFPPDKKIPREGCSRTSIFGGGGNSGGEVSLPRDLLGRLRVAPIASPSCATPPTSSRRLLKTLLYSST